MEIFKTKIAVIGLGYVGLPLAVTLSDKWDTIGFDINSLRVAELSSGKDNTGEVSSDEISKAKKLSFSDDIESLMDRNVFIITVPTPIDGKNNPDLTPLISASELVGKILKQGDIVIYESTVFPGATQEVCIPILEEKSGLRVAFEDTSDQINKFYVGYSQLL